MDNLYELVTLLQAPATSDTEQLALSLGYMYFKYAKNLENVFLFDADKQRSVRLPSCHASFNSIPKPLSLRGDAHRHIIQQVQDSREAGMFVTALTTFPAWSGNVHMFTMDNLATEWMKRRFPLLSDDRLLDKTVRYFDKMLSGASCTWVLIADVTLVRSSCRVCGSNVGMRCCSRCRVPYYCSTECQRLDWREHKRVCGSAAWLRATSQRSIGPEGDTSAVEAEVIKLAATMGAAASEGLRRFRASLDMLNEVQEVVRQMHAAQNQ